MTKKAAKDPADYILPLYMNGLSGRMLRLPPPKNRKREILFVYGHHASLERYFGFAEELNKYGGVTMPDLPGFGGMEPFYNIGKKPTLDDLADYLASFIKLRYKNRRLTIVGFSLGFTVATRMLQKYPELGKKIDIVISGLGFTHKNDIKFKRRNVLLFRMIGTFFSRPLPAAFFRYVILRKSFIRFAYKVVEDRHSKLHDADKEERARRIDFEIKLWHCNDVRTYMYTAVTMLKLELPAGHVSLPVYHIAVDHERYFDHLRVEEHMRLIYSDFHLLKTHIPAHMPSVMASAKEAAPFIPKEARALLRKKT